MQTRRAVCRDTVRGGVAVFVDHKRIAAANEDGECIGSRKSDLKAAVGVEIVCVPHCPQGCNAVHCEVSCVPDGP